MIDIVKSHPVVNFLTVWYLGRLEKSREEGADGGFSVIEWVIGIAVTIAILVGAAVLISGAITTKATSVGKCIEGASSTNNGGCS